MKISVILAHPVDGSFNHAIASRAVKALKRNGHDVFFHDLYRERFDPILTGAEIPKGATLPPAMERHCAAILKGWVDRVIRPGVAYEFLEGDQGDGIPKGLLRARAAVIFNTSNTPAERESSVFGNPLETLWRNCIFGLCGVGNVYRKMFTVVVTSSAAQRVQWLNEVEDAMNLHFP
ncbi:MAG: NAD(P)H-dependent oxidoreductase [Syntrophales bacterium]|nr:NAD(P)H-dependent oxidoreductase [Syntrophales bacterium]